MQIPGTHRKRFQRFHEAGDCHELTFSCYHRLPLLTNDLWREKLARCIDEAGRREAMLLAAFVFMPVHVHLLIYPKPSVPSDAAGFASSGVTDFADGNQIKRRISRYLSLIKQPFSKSIKEILLRSQSELLNRLTVQERPGKTCFRFWQEGPGYDRNLQTSESIVACVRYIHNNPPSRGLCIRAIDWIWSSARWYLLDPARQQDYQLPLIHGLPMEMFAQ